MVKAAVMNVSTLVPLPFLRRSPAMFRGMEVVYVGIVLVCVAILIAAVTLNALGFFRGQER